MLKVIQGIEHCTELRYRVKSATSCADLKPSNIGRQSVHRAAQQGSGQRHPQNGLSDAGHEAPDSGLSAGVAPDAAFTVGRPLLRRAKG